MCLAWAEADALPTDATERYVDAGASGSGTADDPWGRPDWTALDDLLAEGPVVVWISARQGQDQEVFDERLSIERTDPGPHRLVLVGDARYRDADGTWQPETGGARAVWRGASTGLEDVARSYVTLRGLELADSSAQGLYWRAGDGVVLERLLIHDNGRSPALLFDYANRTGLPGRDLVVRSNHLHDVRGECIYIGGAEGTGTAAHSGVLVERNLVHGCGSRGSRLSGQWDGLNLKDELTEVVVRENVVLAAHWGLQIESPAEISGNLFADLASTGIQLSDVWGDGHDGAVLRDNGIVRAGEHGVRIGADTADAVGLAIDGLAVLDVARDGLRFAGEAGISATLDDVVIVGAEQGVEGWGEVSVDVGPCAVGELGEPGEVDGAALLATCTPARLPELSDLAGSDGLLLTGDDPWRVPVTAELIAR